MGKELSYDEVVGILQALVIEKGADYVYAKHHATCVNWGPEGEPRCIVGHLVHRKGWMPDWSSDVFVDDAGTAVECLFDSLDIQTDERTMRLLSEVQGLQDTESSWGFALEQGIKATKEWSDEEEYEYD